MVREIPCHHCRSTEGEKMNDNCRECDRPDTGVLNNYKPAENKTFTCSRCVIKMMQEKEKEKK